MATLDQALAAINTVDFKTVEPTQMVSLADFLERAAVEVAQRERAISEREAAVSVRESALSLREEKLDAQLKALGNVTRLRRILEPREVTSWLRVRK